MFTLQHCRPLQVKPVMVLFGLLLQHIYLWKQLARWRM